MKMKNLSVLIFFCFVTLSVNAQNDLDVLLAAGVDDAQRFANDYLMPGTNGIMHSMNANWFNTADAKPLGGFEISVLANASLINDKNRMFLLNTNDYNNVQFVEGSSTQMVASVLGENDSNIAIEITYDDPIFGNQTEQITLPKGIGSDTGNLLPTAFIQGALGLIKGLEIKARFIPKFTKDKVELSNMFGVGLQMEFTKWMPADKILPVAISGLIAYTHLDGSYDLKDSLGIEGENQRLENDTNTWLFQFIASTKLPILNFYGGIGYITGKSKSNLLGTYRVTDGTLISEDIINPFSVSSQVSSVRWTIGTKLKLGFFRLSAEYHLSEFDVFSVGLSFGLR